MDLKSSTITSYSPVSWDYREVIQEEMDKKTTGKIFFFCQEGICEDQGVVTELVDLVGEGMFIILDNGNKIRIDRIITLFGKPGAAYDEYDAYGNTCMECHGGDDPNA